MPSAERLAPMTTHQHSEYNLEPQPDDQPAQRFVPLWNSDAKVGDDGHIVGNTPCTTCGYNVRGLRAGSPCPSCNTPAGVGSRLDRDDELLEFDAAGYIDQDITCRKCGYNLRGLSQEKMCPECGSPVAWSAQGDRLRFANPGWLMKLYVGILFLTAAAVIIIGTRLVATPFAGIVSDLVLHSAGLAGCLFFALGTWLATTRDPSKDEQEPFNARLAVRYGGLAMLLFSAGTLALVVADGLTGISMLIYIVAVLIWLATIVSLFLYAQELARRVPDKTLVASTWWAMWGVAATFALPLLQVVIIQFGLLGNQVSLYGMVTCMMYVTLIIFSVWSMILLFQYMTAIQEAHRSAKIIWQSTVEME